MKRTGLRSAIRQFCKTTTLHGFKYLTSEYNYDRIGWWICCCASACCAGMLCAVLWARFQQVPALLTLQDLRKQHAEVRMPLVAVCPPADSIAYYLSNNNLSIPINVSDRLPVILNNILRQKSARKEQLALLEDLLNQNNLTLPKALMKVMPPCDKIVRNCRWNYIMMPCEDLFHKEMTQWGVCCISRPYNIKLTEELAARLEVKKRLEVSVQCSDQKSLYGCEFFTKYYGEEWVEPMPLIPGYNYLAQMTFTSVVDSDPEKLVDMTCNPSEGYSKSICLLRCKEKHCKCSEPLQNTGPKERSVLPPCPISKLNCLRTFKFENGSCNCLPSCKKVSTYMSLESSPMNAFQDSYDNLYVGLNQSTGSVLRISLRISGSRLFIVHATETWITLLSSLGGVFNMFLGVGLFSALEILFLLFVRLPIALRKQSEMDYMSGHDVPH